MRRRFPRPQSSAPWRAAVLRELDLVMHGDAKAGNLIEEQLRRCPEAFEVGKIVEKLCDSVKYDGRTGDRLLPPPGAIMPPIV